MDLELRKAMYTAAAIQGMMAAEAPDVTYDAMFIAGRAVEIADTAIGLQDGTLVEPPVQDELPVTGLNED